MDIVDAFFPFSGQQPGLDHVSHCLDHFCLHVLGRGLRCFGQKVRSPCFANEFWGERFRLSAPAMFLPSCVVGIIGGTYGIGGGAILAPFRVTMFPLPVDTVTGAALLVTLSSYIGLLHPAGYPHHTTGHWDSCSASAGRRHVCWSPPPEMCPSEAHRGHSRDPDLSLSSDIVTRILLNRVV
jgi:hypothetical protein